MGRQLFLHHYLPAHLASALVSGALLEFIFNVEPAHPADSIADALSPDSPAALTTEGASPKRNAGAGGARPASARRPIRERLGSQSLVASWLALSVALAVILYGFWFFAPLTYGFPGLTVEEVQKRKWMQFDLHFAK